MAIFNIIEDEMIDICDLFPKYFGSIKFLINTVSNTLIHNLIFKQNNALCENLITDDIDINIENTDGNFILHIAAETDNVYIIELLIKNKANVSVKNNAKQTALHVSAQNGCIKEFRILRKYDSDKSADRIYVEHLPLYS